MREILLLIIKSLRPLLLMAIIIAVLKEITFRIRKRLSQKKTIIKRENNNEPLRRNFEKQIEEVFRNQGYETVLGKGDCDGGKDIVARKNGEIFLIQCKHWRGNRQVGVKEIREFYGSIELYNKKFNKNGKGIFITTGKATEYAIDEAKKLGIQLRDETNYISKLIKVNQF